MDKKTATSKIKAMRNHIDAYKQFPGKAQFMTRCRNALRYIKDYVGCDRDRGLIEKEVRCIYDHIVEYVKAEKIGIKGERKKK